jgi:hypothetical protein
MRVKHNDKMISLASNLQLQWNMFLTCHHLPRLKNGTAQQIHLLFFPVIDAPPSEDMGIDLSFQCQAVHTGMTPMHIPGHRAKTKKVLTV